MHSMERNTVTEGEGNLEDPGHPEARSCRLVTEVVVHLPQYGQKPIANKHPTRSNVTMIHRIFFILLFLPPTPPVASAYDAPELELDAIVAAFFFLPCRACVCVCTILAKEDTAKKHLSASAVVVASSSLSCTHTPSSLAPDPSKWKWEMTGGIMHPSKTCPLPLVPQAGSVGGYVLNRIVGRGKCRPDNG